MQKYTKSNQGNIILKRLSKQYPKAKIALKFLTNMELFAATILSAQCTDMRVNQITSQLFLKYKTVDEYAKADLKTLESEIQSLGLFHVKAKNIIKAAELIEQKHKGNIPQSMQELTALPGVGRKTANIILYNAFKKNEGIAVDTHVKRLSKRIGLTQNSDPEKIELDLMKVVSRKQWGRVNDLFIAHGRSICIAKNPKCGICHIKEFCFFNSKMSCL